MNPENPDLAEQHYAQVRQAIHDLNNLLNVALGNIQLLARHTSEDSARSRLDKAEAAITQAAQAVATLSDLLRKPSD